MWFSVKKSRGSTGRLPWPESHHRITTATRRAPTAKTRLVFSMMPWLTWLLPVPVDDPAASQIVWRELDGHPVSRQNPDVVLPHLPGDVAEHPMAVVQIDPKHRVRE